MRAILVAVCRPCCPVQGSARHSKAVSKKDWADCTSNDPDRSLAGCTNIIDRGKETKPNLAIIYRPRQRLFG